jgi:hypothetical protein
VHRNWVFASEASKKLEEVVVAVMNKWRWMRWVGFARRCESQVRDFRAGG